MQGEVGRQPEVEPHRHAPLSAEAFEDYQAETRPGQEAAQPQPGPRQADGNRVCPGKDRDEIVGKRLKID